MNANLAELKQKAKLPAERVGGKVVADFFAANKQSMMAVLPKHVSADRMTRIALSALRTTPKLMGATTESLMGAVMQLAQLGLEPNTVLGHAYLIPFKNRKMSRTDVQVIIGYKGLIDLARRSGQILSIAAHAVYENDEFDFAYGLDDVLIHRPTMTSRGGIIAFYAVAKLKDGGSVFEVMSAESIDAVMHSSQSRGKYGPWHDHYEEMGRKTTIRRLFKYLPVSIEIATASAMDEVAESGGDQHLETALEGDYAIVPNDYNSDEPEGSVADHDEIIGKKLTDSNGEIWNSDIHATGKNGNAVYNSDGSFRARRGTANHKPEQSQAPEQEAAPAQAQAESGVSYAGIAEMLNRSESQSDLDAAMKQISGLPDDQKGELRSLAHEKSKLLEAA